MDERSENKDRANLLISDPKAPDDHEPKAGDHIRGLTEQYAEKMNNTEFARELRERTITAERYRNYLHSTYKLATEFNRGLIRSLTKIDLPEARDPEVQRLIAQLQTVDHVQNADEARTIARELFKQSIRIAREGGAKSREDLLNSDLFQIAAQVDEEQGHNNFFRDMLIANGLDHEQVTDSFENYMNEQSEKDLDRRTHDDLEMIWRGQHPKTPDDCPLPETVITMSHLLRKISSDPSVPFIVYNAVQSAIELTLFKVISETIYPAAVGPERTDPMEPVSINPVLVPDYDPAIHGNLDTAAQIPRSIRWWDEHASYGKGGSVEARHIDESVKRLNLELENSEYAEMAKQLINDVLTLFTETMGAS